MAVDKAAIRLEALKSRKSLKAQDVKRKSFLICEKAVGLLERLSPKRISIYLPYDNEVNTFPLVSYAMASQIKVFVPVADYEKRVLYHAELKDLSRVKYDRKRIMIPETSDELLSEELVKLDMVFCPGLAFDRRGVRIGHGEGYYDKFLSQLKGTVKLGLAFEVQIFDELPAEPHDVLMDFIITERSIIEI